MASTVVPLTHPITEIVDVNKQPIHVQEVDNFIDKRGKSVMAPLLFPVRKVPSTANKNKHCSVGVSWKIAENILKGTIPRLGGGGGGSWRKGRGGEGLGKRNSRYLAGGNIVRGEAYLSGSFGQEGGTSPEGNLEFMFRVPAQDVQIFFRCYPLGRY